ncbi:helix-turn-helix domain-containing protein [Actinomadura sp.]|uniref:helix-turn-helix domain-containing protein n=1 Tax=Actinomadura sp. TaxID=1989 RepID=UPI00334C96A7
MGGGPLSQVVVAGLVGRSESRLSRVERGRRSIDSHSVLLRLAEVIVGRDGRLRRDRRGLSR